MPAKKISSKKKTSSKKKATRKKTASVTATATSRKKSVTKAASKKKTSSSKAQAKAGNLKKPASSASSSVNGFQDFTPYQPAKGEEYMNAKQIEHFRQILLGWRRELMEEVDRTVHHMQDDAATFADPADRASQEEEFALELRTRDRERKLIKKISEAITTLDTGEYGYCQACGIEIGIQRLEARPTATLCIDCKTLDEIKEKQRA